MNHTPLLSLMEGSAKIEPLYEQDLFRAFEQPVLS